MKNRDKLKRMRRVEKAVKRLQAMDLIYDLGGSRGGSTHNGIENPTGDGLPWTDCSGFALYVMSIAGVKATDPSGWTGTLVDEGKEGDSPYLTLFLKEPFNTEGHVIIRLRRRPRPWHKGVPKFRWAECGGSDNPHVNGGPTFFRPTTERIAEFPFHRNFAQL